VGPKDHAHSGVYWRMVRAIFHESASYLTIPLQSLRAGPIARVRCRAATFVATLFHRDVKACAVTYAAHHGNSLMSELSAYAETGRIASAHAKACLFR
jgi:hypothetical protein